MRPGIRAYGETGGTPEGTLNLLPLYDQYMSLNSPYIPEIAPKKNLNAPYKGPSFSPLRNVFSCLNGTKDQLWGFCRDWYTLIDA